MKLSLSVSASTFSKGCPVFSLSILFSFPLGGVNGQAEDIKIHAEWILRTREKLNRILSENTGQPLEKVEADTDRDNFMSAQEAMEYGIIDKVIKDR
jgi:ATP-dependent Clp protease protease subunit